LFICGNKDGLIDTMRNYHKFVFPMTTNWSYEDKGY
jgi:hypothetical protein